MAAAERLSRTILEVSNRNVSRDIDAYTYRLFFSAVANGASPTLAIPVQSDSDFIWTEAIAAAYVSSDGLPVQAYQGNMTGGGNLRSWPYRIKIIDTGLDRQLMQDPTALELLFGPAGSPRLLPRPRLFKRNSTITVTLTRFGTGQRDQANAAVNVNHDVELVFAGFKVFDPKMLNLTV